MAEEYRQRRAAIGLEYAALPPCKHNILVKAYVSSEVITDAIDEILYLVEKREHKLDFNLIPLIRFLFMKSELLDADLNSYRERIDQILCDLTFWPGDINDERYSCMRKRCLSRNISCAVSDREDQLLMSYLKGHCSTEGVWMYEVLSPVYLPYTFSALLNLYDYSSNATIRTYADTLLNSILYQILLGANRDGISNLTASARTYPKFRRRNWGHNVSMLVFLATGTSIEPPRPTAVTDFMLTSSWIPEAATLKAFAFTGFVQQKMNHSVGDVRSAYGDMDPVEFVPFYWSAGLITHPAFVEDTKAYQSLFSLRNSPGIKLLDFLPSFIVKRTMETYAHYSCGQAYCDIVLNLYKSPSRRVVLSSFDRYNVGRAQYQQMVWMANIAGVPVWSQSGCECKAGLTNTFAPSVTQKGNILIAAYVRPKFQRESLSRFLVDNNTYMCWPSCYFDEEYVRFSQYSDWIKIDESRSYRPAEYPANAWLVGAREGNYVGVLCTESFVIDTIRGGDDCQLQKLKCTKYIHAWICTVGDDHLYPSVHDFLNYCGAIDIGTNVCRRENSFGVTVFDITQGEIYQSVYIG